jgi:hypothetical protein
MKAGLVLRFIALQQLGLVSRIQDASGNSLEGERLTQSWSEFGWRSACKVGLSALSSCWLPSVGSIEEFLP